MYLIYVIALLILGLTAYIVYTEITHKVKTDLLVDIVIALIVIGVSFYNLIDTKFKWSSPLTYIYLSTALLGLVDVALFTRRHLTK